MAAERLEDCSREIGWIADFRGALRGSADCSADAIRPVLDAAVFLNAARTKYAFSGDIAVLFNGGKRKPESMNVLVASGFSGGAVLRGLEQYGFTAASDGSLVHRGGMRLVLDRVSPEDESLLLDSAEYVDYLESYFVKPERLIAMLLRAGRMQDDYDISEILKHREVDLELIRRQVSEDQFARLRQIASRR